MVIDSHQHFWTYDAVNHSWIDDTMRVIRRDFLPKDLELVLRDNEVDGCISVQASQSEQETRVLLDFAKNNSFIKGVVGWVDLCRDNVDSQLEELSEEKKMKGFRHILQAEPKNFMSRKDFQKGISYLSKYNLVYDILIFSNQLKEATLFASQFPNQIFILDHIAKPNIKKREIKTWSSDIRALSMLDNVYCKVSGVITEAHWDNWTMDDIRPYLDVVVESFGVDRLMFGSDWPVCLLAGDYSEVFGTFRQYFENFSQTEKACIFGLNAVKAYNFEHITIS